MTIRCKTCPFIKDGILSFTFKITGQTHLLKQTKTCASKNLIYMIQCRKCKSNAPAEYIGQTKPALRHRFEEHRRSIQNKTDDSAPQHFNQPGHQLKDIERIPFELINTKRESIRRARERFYIEKTQTMQPQGQNREDDRKTIYVLIDFIIIRFFILF